MRIHGQAYLGVEPLFCAAHSFVFTLRTRAVVVDFHVTGLDRHPLVIDALFEQCFPSPLWRNARNTMRVFPIAVVGRQIAPRRATALNPENGIEKAAIVTRDALHWRLDREDHGDRDSLAKPLKSPPDTDDIHLRKKAYREGALFPKDRG